MECKNDIRLSEHHKVQDGLRHNWVHYRVMDFDKVYTLILQADLSWKKLTYMEMYEECYCY